MKVHVKHTLKTDVASRSSSAPSSRARRDLRAARGTDVKIKREGRAPNVKLKISRRNWANPPAAIRKLVPSTNDVSHTEDWGADGDGYAAPDLAIEIKGVPVKISGTKRLQPEKGGCSVEWTFRRHERHPVARRHHRSFAGSEVEQKLAEGIQDPQVHGLSRLLHRS